MSANDGRLVTHHVRVGNWAETGDVDVRLYFCHSICIDTQPGSVVREPRDQGPVADLKLEHFSCNDYKDEEPNTLIERER